MQPLEAAALGIRFESARDNSRFVGKPEPSHFTTIRHRGGWPLRSSRSLLAATLTLLSGGFQLAVAVSVNLDLSASKHMVWRHIADGAVKPDVVITVHMLLDQAFCIFERKRRARPNAFALQ